MMYTAGTCGRPAAMVISSTTLKSCGSSAWVDAAGAAHREHHLVAAVVADDAPGDGDDAEHAEQPDAALRAADGGVADGEAQHGQDGDDEPGEQPGRPAVAADLFVHAGVRPRRPRAYLRSTVGTAFSASGTSKNWRVVKLNMPAMRLDGKVCTLLLNVSTLSL